MNAAPKRFPARNASLGDVLAYVAGICHKAGLIEKDQVLLVVEELFSNTLLHGYRQESEQPVWISADCDSDYLHLTYQDEAPAFNPLDQPVPLAPDTPGGWGIQLIKRFSGTDYRYDNGRNTLRLSFKISRAGGSHDTRAD